MLAKMKNLVVEEKGQGLYGVWIDFGCGCSWSCCSY